MTALKMLLCTIGLYLGPRFLHDQKGVGGGKERFGCCTLSLCESLKILVCGCVDACNSQSVRPQICIIIILSVNRFGRTIVMLERHGVGMGLRVSCYR